MGVVAGERQWQGRDRRVEHLSGILVVPVASAVAVVVEVNVVCVAVWVCHGPLVGV